MISQHPIIAIPYQTPLMVFIELLVPASIREGRVREDNLDLLLGRDLNIYNNAT